jgi:hypothetical protein
LRHVDFAVTCIQRALARVENDRFTPAVLSPQIPDYLIDLTVKNPNECSELSKFVTSLSYDAIENELLRQILPENLKQTILDYRAEQEALQIKKEDDILEGDFDSAAERRDQQERIWLSIRNLIVGQELIVTPNLIDSVLKSLGYNGA